MDTRNTKIPYKTCRNNSALSKRGPKWIAEMLESLIKSVENYGCLFETEPQWTPEMLDPLIKPVENIDFLPKRGHDEY